jgi:glycosyltransferase involved in cell wall biosynthesis
MMARREDAPLTPPAHPERRPLVTALVAAYQAGPFVDDALASLRRQTVTDLEILVVDDGSTDGTSERVRRASRRDGRIRLRRLDRNRGQPAALNAGLELARGRYLALLDADDEATPDRLERQFAAFEADPGLVLVGGAVTPWCPLHSAEGPAWRYRADDAGIRVRSLFKSEFISGAMTVDLDRARAHGLRFDETLRLGADWAFSIEAMRVGRVANVGEVVMRYRIHPAQGTAGMVDDLGSDAARIRAAVLSWAGAAPTDEELRIHLAVSPCNYWPYGAHPYFRARRASIAGDARRWFERLREASARAGRIPRAALEAYLAEIESLVAGALAEAGPPCGGLAACPAAWPRACVGESPCRIAPEEPRPAA